MILNKLICVEKSSVFFLSSIKLSTHLGDVDVSHFTRLLMVVCGYISDLCLIFEFFTSTNFTRAHRSKPTYIASTSPASVDVLTLLKSRSFLCSQSDQAIKMPNKSKACALPWPPVWHASTKQQMVRPPASPLGSGWRTKSCVA
jgi:hypothetical protein